MYLCSSSKLSFKKGYNVDTLSECYEYLWAIDMDCCSRRIPSPVYLLQKRTNTFKTLNRERYKRLRHSNRPCAISPVDFATLLNQSLISQYHWYRTLSLNYYRGCHIVTICYTRLYRKYKNTKLLFF